MATPHESTTATPGLSPTITQALSSVTPEMVTPEMVTTVVTPTVWYEGGEAERHPCERVPPPEVTQNPSNEVFLSGNFHLCRYGGQSTFDFDTGVIGGDSTTIGDMILSVRLAGSEVRHFVYELNEINGALSNMSEQDAPTIDYCRQLMSADIRFQYTSDIPDSVAGCVLTSEKRLAMFRVERIDPDGADSIEVSFVTWKGK